METTKRNVQRKYLYTLLGTRITMFIDRPIGFHHPSGIVYPIHYGYLPGIPGGDDEEQDAYLLHVTAPVTSFTGYAVALILREDDCEDKFVLSPELRQYAQNEIEDAVHFQEQYFRHTIVLWTDEK